MKILLAFTTAERCRRILPSISFELCEILAQSSSRYEENYPVKMTSMGFDDRATC